MKDTTSKSSKRLAQVAKELHRLADGIGAGQVQISGVGLTLSDSVSLKVKQKMTGTKVIFDLKIQALLATEDTRSKNKTVKKKKPSKGTARPYGVKVLKKKYTGLWREIASLIKKGQRPAESAALDLDAVSKEYGELAPPEWTLLWRESEVLVMKCIACAQDGDFSTANKLLTEIGRAKKSCHKMYK